jgi:hypothetical protein
MNASAAQLTQAVRQSGVARRPSTTAPDRAMPAPMPPKPQPTRCWVCARSRVSMAVTAITKTRALATPAVSRSANHTAWSSVTAISASVPVSTSSPARSASTDRTSAGAAMPASAPIR